MCLVDAAEVARTVDRLRPSFCLDPEHARLSE